MRLEGKALYCADDMDSNRECPAMKIGELAAQTGVSAKTIRYYEDIRLLPDPERTPNGYRDYAEESVELLKFIRDAQATGLTLAEITSIVEHKIAGDSTCDDVLQMLGDHLKDIEGQIATLTSMRMQLVDIFDQARDLDPADCTDSIRCQTISANTRAKRAAREAALVHNSALQRR
jgi:MerR family transcriptional regulator, copper efflux regulator